MTKKHHLRPKILSRTKIKGEIDTFCDPEKFGVALSVNTEYAPDGFRDKSRKQTPMLAIGAYECVDRQYLSSKKANRLLGWKCRYSLDDGLRLTFAWYAKYLKCQNL